jgi:hypothetical protein
VSSVFGIFVVLFSLAALVLWIWALVDIVKTNFTDSTQKLIWVLVVLLASFVGSILWLVWGRHNVR